MAACNHDIADITMFISSKIQYWHGNHDDVGYIITTGGW